MEAEQKRENRLRWFWGICLVILWGCAIALFVRANGHLSVQELLRYQPENKVLAAFAMWGLFLLPFWCFFRLFLLPFSHLINIRLRKYKIVTNTIIPNKTEIAFIFI